MTTKTKKKPSLIYKGEDEIISMTVKTDIPPKKKPNDVQYIGNKLADLSDRVLKIENMMKTLNNSLKRVMGRMGL